MDLEQQSATHQFPSNSNRSNKSRPQKVHFSSSPSLLLQNCSRSRPLADILTTDGLPPVPPYPGSSTLPPYSSTATQDVPVNNIGSEINYDQISSTSLTYTSFAAQTSVISLNSTDTGELPVPPTPLIRTVPLPTVETESTINNVVRPEIPFRSGMDGRLITRPVCSNDSNDGIQFETESTNNLNLDLESAQPTGSLGLIFKLPLTSCDVHADFDNLCYGRQDKSSAPLVEGDDPAPRQSTSGI